MDSKLFKSEKMEKSACSTGGGSTWRQRVDSNLAGEWVEAGEQVEKCEDTWWTGEAGVSDMFWSDLQSLNMS